LAAFHDEKYRTNSGGYARKSTTISRHAGLADHRRQKKMVSSDEIAGLQEKDENTLICAP